MTNEQAIKVLNEMDLTLHLNDNHYEAIDKAVEALQAKKIGKWIPIEDADCWRGFVCSKCGKAVNKRENYCPQCGAKMDREEEK